MTAATHRFREPSATEAIYLKTSTQVISRSRVVGRITEAQFSTALALLEMRYIILRAAVQSGHFIEMPERAPTPVTWLTAGTVSPAAVYENLLDTRLELSRGLYTATVLADRDGFEIFLLTSHAVTDATSLVELHSFLIYLCDCAVRGAMPEIVEQPFPDNIDDAVAHCLRAIGGRAAPRTPADYSGAFLRLPAKNHANGHAGGLGLLRHRMHRLEIPPEVMRHVIEASHNHDVSVHSLLVAAFALAIRDLSENTASRILVRASVDLRRRLEPHLSIDLVFSAITAHITAIENLDGTIFDIAAQAFQDVHSATEDGRVFQDYENYPRAFGNPQEAPVAINISDMGSVSFHAAIETLQAKGFEYATGLMKTYPNVSITIYEGTLVATITYIDGLIASASILQLCEGVKEKLLLCAVP